MNKNQKAKRRAAGLCYDCGSIAVTKKYCQLHASMQNRRARERNKRNRDLVLTKYGGKCACPLCGTTDFDFLTIDHIDGGGEAHRKEVGGGTHFYNWVIKNNYPAGLQVLCANCNLSKLRNGVCHHQRVVQVHR